MATQNIAVKLCGILQSKSGEEVTAREWRLLGQEQDGSQLLSWLSKNKDSREVLNLGVYTNKTKTLTPLYEFLDKPNIIQASVNASHSLLVYVVKQLPMLGSDQQPLYCPYLVSLLPDNKEGPLEVEEGSTKQIMLQYVYGKANKYSPGIRNDRFVLFKHLEYIKIYRTPMFLNELDDGTDKWSFDGIWPDPETIVNVFTWAQWDCVNQVLYYIHYRATQASFAEGEVPPSPPEPTPTLSALQFHARLPHETVLNIPLSLGHAGSMEGACGEYEDDPIPLRVHDCSLDLQILCDQRGVLCVCHHYLYKPLDDSTTSLVLEDNADLKESGVNFACSITLLQHGCVVHSVVPDLPWVLAKSLRPSYLLYSENHLLVNIPQLYTHLIDISLYHEPCCHVVIPSEDESRPALAPIIGWGSHAMVNLKTLDVVTVSVAEKDLAATFRSNTSTDNRLSILHYLIQHEGNLELAEELIGKLCLSRTGLACVQRCLQQYLVAATYCATRRALPAAAVPLVAMLPFTAAVRLGEMQVGSGQSVCVSQEAVWQVAAVVLAPRQRVCQFAEDVWTRVWTRLAAPPPARMRVAGAAERLQRTLHCYQPEALSRCSTPLSPAGPARRGSLGGADLLPFVELDECTASKQEHVVAANLRSVSVHLMRSARGADAGAHALATRWAAAQLDAARALCRALCRTMHALPAAHQHRGFAFIDEMDPKHAYLLFKVLEQYYLAADSIAFPLPQGFTSFFTYLGYRTMPFHAFVMHVHRNVFELQIDVMKAIVADKDDTKQSVNNKLRLIQLCGEGRAKRALSAWSHRAALTVRAREHAGALLAGAPARTADTARHRAPGDDGIAALPNGERLSPLDTFLDLLTAKASLNELDFNLIIEATLASVQQENAA